MEYLKKLHNQELFDVTLQPQGQNQDGDFAVLAKVEIMEKADTALSTVRKVSVFGFGKSLKTAQTNALKDAVKLLGL